MVLLKIRKEILLPKNAEDSEPDFSDAERHGIGWQGFYTDAVQEAVMQCGYSDELF